MKSKSGVWSIAFQKQTFCLYAIQNAILNRSFSSIILEKFTTIFSLNFSPLLQRTLWHEVRVVKIFKEINQNQPRLIQA